jgi:hypothetical protein
VGCVYYCRNTQKRRPLLYKFLGLYSGSIPELFWAVKNLLKQFSPKYRLAQCRSGPIWSLSPIPCPWLLFVPRLSQKKERKKDLLLLFSGEVRRRRVGWLAVEAAARAAPRRRPVVGQPRRALRAHAGRPFFLLLVSNTAAAGKAAVLRGYSVPASQPFCYFSS